MNFLKQSNAELVINKWVDVAFLEGSFELIKRRLRNVNQFDKMVNTYVLQTQVVGQFIGIFYNENYWKVPIQLKCDRLYGILW